MNELLIEVARAQQLTAWAVAFTGMLTFLGLVITAVTLYLARDVRRAVSETQAGVRSNAELGHDIARILEKMDERSERLGYYLFSKLGPVDTK